MKICFLNGPHKGTEFLIKKNLIFCRNKKQPNGVLITDPKASNPHAKIIKKNQGFYLKDLDSKNGTYVNKKINPYFALTQGLEFKIGKTLFIVKPDLIKQIPWTDTVAEELKKLSLKNNIKQWKIINPTLILQFKSGVQKGVKWFICYGPRKAGAESLDLPILESQAPDICFLLEPKLSGVLFKTQYPNKIFINKESLLQKQLVAGDIITFKKTSIKVEYEDN